MHSAQHIFILIQVITIKLHNETPTSVTVHCIVPTTTDEQVSTLWHKVNKSFVLPCYIRQECCCAICTMIVYHDDVIIEIRLLRQCRTNSVTYRTHSIVNRYHYRHLTRIVSFIIHLLKCVAIHPSSSALQKERTNGFSLLLYFSITRIDIVKLFLSRGTHINSLNAISTCLIPTYYTTLFHYFQCSQIDIIKSRITPLTISIHHIFRHPFEP